MFDEFSQTDDAEEKAEEDDRPARSWALWSHVIAGVVFCLLYFPLKAHTWSWPLAVAGAYSAFAFAIGLGNSLDDYNDLLGEPRIPEYIARLLPDHLLILAPVTLVAWLMLRAVPILPYWLTADLPRYGSLWQLFGLLLFYFAGVREGLWLSRKIKRQREKLDI